MQQIAALVGQRIRQIRVYKKMSQEDLAFQANLHPAQVGHIERGEQAATLETLNRLAVGLGVSLSQLVDYGSVYTERSVDDETQQAILSCVRQLPAADQQDLLVILKILVRWAAKRDRKPGR